VFGGLRFGVDFTGGSILEVEYTNERPAVEALQTQMKETDFTGFLLQPTGEKGLIVRTETLSEEGHANLIKILAMDNQSPLTERRFSFVGGIVGKELQGKAYWDEKIRKFKATLLELETRKATGELIPREDVEKGQIARVMAIKRAFLALPSQVAPKLAMKEPREIEVIIYEAISAIVDEFAGVKNNEEEVVDVSDAQRGPADLEQRGTTSVAPASEDNSQSVG